MKKSVAYQALSRISLIYKLEGTLKDLSPKERLRERQEKYLRVFLTDGDAPIDNSASELPKLCDEKGNIEKSKLDILLPWSKELSDECRKPCR